MRIATAFGSACAGVRVRAASAAACGSGKSIIVAGNDTPTATTVPVPPAHRPTCGHDRPGRRGVAPAAEHDAGEQPATTPPATNATTTTTPLSSLPDCPVDALDERVRAGRDHVLARPHRPTTRPPIQRITDDYNASQDRVHVSSENQGGYLETIDKFFQSSQSTTGPTLVMFPEYTTQQVDRLRHA